MPDEKFVSVAKAREVADLLGNDEFSAAVAKAEDMELSFVEVFKDADGDITLRQPTGVMIGWFQPDTDWGTSFKVDGGEQDSHISFVYLGEVDDMDVEDQRALIGITAEVCQRHTQMFGVVEGSQTFDLPDGTHAWVANVDVPELAEFRADLVSSLAGAGVMVNNDYEFTPHLTLAYLDADQTAPAVDVAKTGICIDKVTVAIAGLHFELGLDPKPYNYNDPDKLQPGQVDWREPPITTPFIPIIKDIDGAPKRFTLAPVYIPMTKDAHGDWATSDDLQESLWEFMKGDKNIAIQHNKELIGHGQVVEMMTIPWAHTVDMPDENGIMKSVSFPAGTPWMGVVWDEAAFELVQKGYFRGYSIGGRAALLDVDLPEDILKYNDNHDDKGRFASGSDGEGNGAPSKYGSGVATPAMQAQDDEYDASNTERPSKYGSGVATPAMQAQLLEQKQNKDEAKRLAAKNN